MSTSWEPSPEDYAAEAAARAASGNQQQLSRLAVISAAAAFLPVPVIGGLLGPVLGFLALRQINTSRSLIGANFAWIGIIAGLSSWVIWGTAYRELSAGLEAAPRVVTPCMVEVANTGVTEPSNGCGDALQAALRKPAAMELRAALTERFVSVAGSGEPPELEWSVADGFPPSVDVRLKQKFTTHTGKPLEGTFTVARERGEWRVIAFELESPALTDLRSKGWHIVRAQAAGEIHDFDPASEARRPGMKQFKK